MDANKFEKMARNPSLSQVDLETLVSNTLAKGNREFANIATQVLAERFPSAKVVSRSGGATPTTVRLLDRTYESSTGKEAYLWMVERLREYHDGLLENQDKWHARAFAGTTRRYFAKSAEALFDNAAVLNRPGVYAKLSDGWFANTNMNHAQKFEVLLRLAAICGLAYPDNWGFSVTGATVSLADHQMAAAESEQLLQAFLLS